MKNSDPIRVNNIKQIAVGSSGKYRLVNLDEIIYMRSDSCYTKIYLTDNSSYTICKTLKDYQQELDKRLFIRCHNSFLVNRMFIKELISQNHDYLLLKTGDKIPISRRRYYETRRLVLSATI